MEEDRFKKDEKSYLAGIIFLLISLSLFAFSAYILPNLLFGWRYKIPLFISDWKYWIALEYDYSEGASSFFIFLFFLFFAVVTGLIAYVYSNRIDDKIYMEEIEKPEESTIQHAEKAESRSFMFKFVMVIIGAMILMIFLNWFLYVPPPATEFAPLAR